MSKYLKLSRSLQAPKPLDLGERMKISTVDRNDGMNLSYLFLTSERRGDMNIVCNAGTV